MSATGLMSSGQLSALSSITVSRGAVLVAAGQGVPSGRGPAQFPNWRGGVGHTPEPEHTLSLVAVEDSLFNTYLDHEHSS